MSIKLIVAHFCAIFTLALAVTGIVTFLYSLTFHGAGAVDWKTAFRSAITLGVVLTWAGTRRGKTRDLGRDSD